MGAASILKAVNDEDLSPSGIIIECPFSSLKTTVDARFKMMGIPAFPLSNLLVFWGGIENGFNAFGYEPVEYAKAVQCPTLLFYGAQDPKVSLAETEAIYKNLNGLKEKVIFEKAAHGNYWLHYEELWKNKTRFFLKNFNSTFPEQISL
jgi:pimeloyl-ACP methyl ester carboxylesterase